MSRFLAAALLAASLAMPALAQESRATITGRVLDTSDAIVVGAKVHAINLQTGLSGTVVSNESGSFVIPFLLPGAYRVTVEMSGFKTYAQDDVRLRVNDTLDLRIRLEPQMPSGHDHRDDRQHLHECERLPHAVARTRTKRNERAFRALPYGLWGEAIERRADQYRRQNGDDRHGDDCDERVGKGETDAQRFHGSSKLRVQSYEGSVESAEWRVTS